MAVKMWSRFQVFPLLIGKPYIPSLFRSSLPVISAFTSAFCSFNDDKKFTFRRNIFKLNFREQRNKPKLRKRKVTNNGPTILQNLKEARKRIKQNIVYLAEKDNIWAVPNILCIARIVISPYIGYLIINEDLKIALYLVTVASITDLVDGIIARKFPNQASKLGTFLDPLADKVLIGSLSLTLTYADLLPIYLTILILVRDITLTSVGFYIHYKSLPPSRTLFGLFYVTHSAAKLSPTFLSKFNTTVQLITIIASLTSPLFGFVDHHYLYFLWYFTAATTLGSAVNYAYSKNTYQIFRPRRPFRVKREQQ